MEKRRVRVLAASFTAAAFAVSVGFGVQGYARAEDYRRQLDNGYRQAFTELTTAAGELDAALEKVTYATTPSLFASLCAQAYAKALAAQTALGELPYGNVELEQTAAFFAKAGDYAMAMARGASGEGVCTVENRETLRGLAAAAGELSGTLQALQLQLDGGALHPEDVAAAEARLAAAEARLAAAQEDGEPVTSGSAFQTVEADFPQVPTLIYDGPFSEHLSGRTPQMLEGLPQVTEEEARRAAAAFAGLRAEVFTPTSDGAGNLPAWGFSALADGGELYVEITKQGGQVLQMLSSRPVGEAALSRKEGVEQAASFLDAHGYQDMSPSYFLEGDGILTVHFAPVLDGVYCYPDLVKVGVALDNGDVVSFEAHGYLMNHGAREPAAPAVSADEAAERVDTSLTVLSRQLALIPTGGEYEVLCHEFKCQNADGGHVLVYVNAATGQQERILLLLEDENGTLVI